jgi:hypothetical protein
MFEGSAYIESQLNSIVHQHPEADQKPLVRIADEHLQFGVVAKAIDLVMRDQSVSPREAMAMICHYWLVSEGIDPIGANPLLDSSEYGHDSQTQTKLQGAIQWLLSEG